MSLESIVSNEGWTVIAHAVATKPEVKMSEAIRFMDGYVMEVGTEIEVRIRPSRGEVEKYLKEVEKHNAAVRGKT